MTMIVGPDRLGQGLGDGMWESDLHGTTSVAVLQGNIEKGKEDCVRERKNVCYRGRQWGE